MERYFYFGEDDVSTTGEACMFSLSSFLGMQPAGATSTTMHFQARNGTAADDDILLTHVTGKFRQVAEALADALSNDSGELVIFANEDNAVYSKKLRDLGCIDSSSTIVTTHA